jgi:transcriptional repressor NrdR
MARESRSASACSCREPAGHHAATVGVLRPALTCDDVQCPSCGADDTKVVDSRLAEHGAAIRRRRQCLSCGYRFTTFERAEAVPLIVVKSDGRREPFDRTKVIAGVIAATKGRAVSVDAVDELADRVEAGLRSQGQHATSASIGLAVLEQLRAVDDVAYLRFASVYKNFDAAADFHRELELLGKLSSGAPSG